MKPLISPDTMRRCERAYFESGAAASIDVMERAAGALADAIRAEVPAGESVYFACGTGGNGGDGLACARLLCGDYRCAIVLPDAPKSPDALENLRRAQAAGVAVHTDASALLRPCAWVDALFGTGLSRAPQGASASLIRRIADDRALGTRVFSADIPSGLGGATGRAYEPCVHADRTIAFHLLKTGMVLGDGLDACGETTVADVGFPASAFPSTDALLLEPSDILALLRPRPRNLHKNLCGHLLIVAGSFGMAGAAAMCALAALRSGTGLVTVACPASIVPILQTLAPAAMCVPLEEEGSTIADAALPQLEAALSGKDAVVIGCGLSRRAAPGAVRLVLESGLPAVIDADALNLLAETPSMRTLLRPHHVLTPHPGEARRLIPDLPADNPIVAAHLLNALGATAFYKGASCIACQGGETYVSASGCCGMARGGSGDILSGVMGALLAQPDAPHSVALTAALASEIHGLAGERAQAKYGSRAMNAWDILEFLPEVFPS